MTSVARSSHKPKINYDHQPYSPPFIWWVYMLVSQTHCSEEEALRCHMENTIPHNQLIIAILPGRWQGYTPLY